MRRLPVLLTAALAGASLLLSGCGDDTTVAKEPVKAAPISALGEPGSSATSGDCTWTADGRPPSAAATFPAAKAVATATGGTMKTNHGDISFSLDTDTSACTVLSMESLADQRYFDNTICHRLTQSSSLSVLQCGDPGGQGNGGPGYTIPDEFASAEALADVPDAGGVKLYPAGALAMANTGAPNSGGSQFFLVYEDSMLPPTYTVFGQMDAASLAVVRKIATAGFTEEPGGNTAPTEQVDVDSLRTS